MARVEAWRWSSLGHRQLADDQAGRFLAPWLVPVPEPTGWVEMVNRPETEAELEAVRRSVLRSCPFGSAAWQQQTATQLKLEAIRKDFLYF